MTCLLCLVGAVYGGSDEMAESEDNEDGKDYDHGEEYNEMRTEKGPKTAQRGRAGGREDGEELAEQTDNRSLTGL